jgi:hypothetical protein
MTRTRRPEFHIHIDASWIAAAVEDALVREHGFAAMDFDLNNSKPPCYAPERHLTRKVFAANEFKQAFNNVERIAETTRSIRGYIEGEFVALNETIEGRSYDPAARLGVRFGWRELQPGTFRESEVHITFRRSPPDDRLERSLLDAGFFAVLLPKADGMAKVFTAHGSRRDIRTLVPPVLDFLRAAGGFEMVKVKEERIARWWISDSRLPVPPVIDHLQLVS